MVVTSWCRVICLIFVNHQKFLIIIYKLGLTCNYFSLDLIILFYATKTLPTRPECRKLQLYGFGKLEGVLTVNYFYT